MSARDVINTACINLNQRCDSTYATVVINTLTSSGYRILGPDEIDAVTVEKCVAEMEANWGHVCTPELRDAIRALCATQQGDK